jgi:hypothetical protein
LESNVVPKGNCAGIRRKDRNPVLPRLINRYPGVRKVRRVVPGPSGTFFEPAEGRNSVIIDAGVSVQWTPTLSSYINYDGQLGRDRYGSNAVTGGFRVGF